MHRDAVLVELVRSVNAGGPRVPVSLLIGGALVTGQLISAQDYADALGLTTVATTPTPDDLVFAHLDDATVNGQAFGWWRVQIEYVAGISLLPALDA